MEKKHLTRLGYGSLALVLGLNMLSCFPTAKAYAESLESAVDSVADSVLDSVADSVLDSVADSVAGDLADKEILVSDSVKSMVLEETEDSSTTDSTAESKSDSLSMGLAKKDSMVVDFAQTDSELLDSTQTDSTATDLGQTDSAAVISEGEGSDGDSRGGDVPVRSQFETNVIVRAISTGEPFIFIAAPGVNPIVWDMTEGTGQDMELMDAVLIGDTEVLDGVNGATGYYGGFGGTTGYYGGFGGMRIADPDDISIEETNEGEYAVTVTKPGVYVVFMTGYIADANVYQATTITLTAINTDNEAAKTIKDTLNANYKDGKAMWEASQEYFRGMFAPGITDDERMAMAEDYQQTVEKLNKKIEQRTENTFGEDSEAIMEAVNSGKTITTDVSVTYLDETEVADEVKDALLDKLDITFTGNISYYDVKVVVYADGEEIGTLKELTGKQAIVIGGFEWAPSGYKRVFKVLAYHSRVDEDGAVYNEVIEIDDVDFDMTTGSISFDGDKFSTYMVAYKDVFAPSVNTGVATENEGASVVSNMNLSVLVVVAVVLMAGVAKFVKVRK